MLVRLRSTERAESDGMRMNKQSVPYRNQKGCSKIQAHASRPGFVFCVTWGVYDTPLCCGLDDFLFITICGFVRARLAL